MKTVILAFLALAAPAHAAAFQDIPALEARLSAALGAGVGEPGGPAASIDRRLKLAQCPQTVTIDPPAIGAVALRCTPLNWRIRVPLARLAGSTGGSGAVAMAVKVAPVVRKGDPVDLVAEQSGFSVSVSAIAQEDGAPGSRIRVRADGAGKPQGQMIFAEVIDAGRVRLPGFK